MKSLPQWGATVLLAAPFGAWGLGLGDIELQSALNEPFSAQIALTSATAEELDSLRVGLAGPETFERYGLERPFELSSLEFRVMRTSDGRGVIRVTSRQPIADPFLTMLVEVTWPRGRLLREYTVLLDPPLFSPDLGAEPPIRQAATLTPRQGAGAISRTPEPASERSAPASARTTPAPARTAPARSAAAAPAAELGGSYGPVRRAETLWGIASSLRPSDVTINQMMVAIFEANPAAFNGNMNVLLRGATLAVPEREQLLARTAAAATAEVSRQESIWEASRGAVTADAGPAAAEPEQSQARLRLVPAATGSGAAEAGAGNAVEAGAGAVAAAAADAEAARLESEVESLRGELGESRRLLELRDEELRDLQARLGAAEEAAAEDAMPETPADAAPAVTPGVDLESEQLFADEEPAAAEPQAESRGEAAAAALESEPERADVTPPASAVTPRATAVSTVTTTAAEPSLLSRIFGWISNPLLFIGLGVGAVLLTAVWYLRNRRDDEEDLTGRWEALEADVEEEEAVREDTARLRRGDFGDEGAVFAEPGDADASADRGAAAGAAAGDIDIDDTLSSQTVINLDQADSLAEADFHMAYGLYDQAADLVLKALENEPDRRDLKLKLLEVYFVWGNKDAFLDAAKDLHAEIGGQGDRDWDKVLIMGKQICPDEPMFDESAAGGGDVDVDLRGDGSTELDFAFEDNKVELNLDDDGDAAVGSSTGTGLDFAFGASTAGGVDFGATTATGDDDGDEDDDSSYALDDSLDIGEHTAAGLEAALFSGDEDTSPASAAEDVEAFSGAFGDEDDEHDTATDVGSDLDALAVTQESPTIERPQADENDWSVLSFDSSTVEEPTGQDFSTVEQAFGPDSPTVETPTIETAGPDAPTVETPRIETGYGGTARLEVPSSDTPFGEHGSGEHTEEIDLDDLGLNLDDLGTLSGELGEQPQEEDDDADTREQPALDASDDLLSATGVTEVLADDELEHMSTEVLGQQDATMHAPGSGDETLGGGTEILEERRAADGSGDTSLLKMLDGTDGDANGSSASGLDLDLEDLASALGGDTVEQPRSFESDIFANGGDTPVDLDVGMDVVGNEDPTATEDIGPLDPQTMTEIGTKLDLARAYIDMGDPEGARSILEEVLDEGDTGQRREAQGLIDVLSA